MEAIGPAGADIVYARSLPAGGRRLRYQVFLIKQDMLQLAILHAVQEAVLL